MKKTKMKKAKKVEKKFRFNAVPAGKPAVLDLKKELKRKCDFRVAIFGSARIKRKNKVYHDVYQLAKMVGMRGFDLITGGGPGLMEAASAGHSEGDKLRRAWDIGLRIRLPFEQAANQYLELRKDFSRFSDRLETFMQLSSVIVVTKGGIGTLLELYFCWQLLQVRHVDFKPIILIGEMWPKLIQWMKHYQLRERLVDKKDFDFIYMVKDTKEAMKIINKYHQKYVKNGNCKLTDAHGHGKEA